MQQKRRLVVHLRHFDGTDHQLIGRAAFIAAWLDLNKDRINDATKGSIEIHWGGPDLTFQLTPLERVCIAEGVSS